MELNRVVVDTSVLISEYLSKNIDKIKVKEIIIPLAVIDELQAQANKGYEKGLVGLREIQKLRELSSVYGYKLTIIGKKPTLEEIKLAKSGAIDLHIIRLASKINASVITQDRIFYETAKSLGLEAYLIEEKEKYSKLSFEYLFTEDTMSVHIIENIKVRRKRGRPGNWYLEEVDVIYRREEIEKLIEEILYYASNFEDSFIEKERRYSIIAQIGLYRIVIIKPPLSDSYEITIVKPVKILKLEDYNLPEKLMNRLKDKAEGIIIAGKPGSGKTTFAQALAEFYNSLNRIVKTIESPRDLLLSKNIIQLSKNIAKDGELSDLFLLSRPDYVIFDEMRTTEDFKIYADLRLTGIGMVGVIHAERPIDVIHRLIYRIDLGMIPQIVDTILFIENGNVKKVYVLELKVKVPHGLKEEDLARPVVEVRDFYTNEIEYEIYTFGEEIMVVPIKKFKKKTGVYKLLEDILSQNFRYKYSDIYINVEENEIYIYIPSDIKKKFIRGEKGYLRSLMDKYNIKIHVKSLEQIQDNLPYELNFSKNEIIIKVNKYFKNKEVKIFLDNEFLGNFKVNKNGKIMIDRESDIGKKIESSIELGKDLKIVL